METYRIIIEVGVSERFRGQLTRRLLTFNANVYAMRMLFESGDNLRQNNRIRCGFNPSNLMMRLLGLNPPLILLFCVKLFQTNGPSGPLKYLSYSSKLHSDVGAVSQYEWRTQWWQERSAGSMNFIVFSCPKTMRVRGISPHAKFL